MNTSSPAITPFWQRLREITLYPSRPAALMTVVLLALLRLLAFLPGVGWIVGLAIWVAVYKYAFEVLRDSANGRTEPPEGSLNVDESLGWGGIGLQFMFVLLNVLALVLLPAPLALLVVLLLALGMPGAVMSYAMDENFWHALNPATWLAVMARLGWPYFLAVILILVINLGAQNAQGLVARVMPQFIGIPIFYCIAHYALIATYHLMGYLIYQYHDVLGYEPKEQVVLKRPLDADQGVLDDADELVQQGETDAAAAMLRGHLRERGGSDAVHAQYRKLLRRANDRAELLRHAQERLPALLAQDKDKAALDLLHETLLLDPGFAPPLAEQVTRLAGQAAQLGQAQLALRLLQGFAKRFPKSPDIPANYLLAARLLSERMGKDAEARALLRQLKAAFPQHELMPQVDALLAMLDKLGAAGPASPAAPA